jgi:hypothetical protein
MTSARALAALCLCSALEPAASALAFYNSDGQACRGAWPADEAALLDKVLR